MTRASRASRTFGRVTDPGGADQLDFQFVLRRWHNFTLFYNNTSAPSRRARAATGRRQPADGKRILDLMRGLPPTDFNFSSFSSGNTDKTAGGTMCISLEACVRRS